MNAQRSLGICFGALLAVLMCRAASAQSPLILWQHEYGGNSLEEAFYNGWWPGTHSTINVSSNPCVVATRDSGYIIADFTISNNGDVTNNRGSADGWVVKVDSLGAIQWQRTLGGTKPEYLHFVQQTFDGGYVLAGMTASPDGDGAGNHGIYDFWIVKLDSTGATQWERILGGSRNEAAYSIQQTTDSGYIAAGFSYSTDGDVHGNHGNNLGDFWIVKLDVSGTVVWDKSFGGTGYEGAYSIQQTADGGFIAAGFDSSTDGDVTGNHGGFDYWVVKMSATGTLQWQKSLGGSGTDYAYCIRQSTDRGYIVVGASSSADNDVTGHHGTTGSFDAWVVKLDSNGVQQWQNSLGGTADDVATNVIQMADGQFLVAGCTKSFDGDVTGNHGFTGYYDGWLVMLDSLGNITWNRAFGGSGGDGLGCVMQTAKGDFVAVGGSTSTNGDATATHGGGDLWLLKIGYIPIIASVKTVDAGSMICDTTATVTAWVHNVGNKTLVISSYAFTGLTSAELRLISPTTFPLSIAAGDSLAFVVKRSTSVLGSKIDSIMLTNSDQTAGHSPWPIAFTARKEHIALAVPSLTIVDSLHAGATKLVPVVFTTTGTLFDTIVFVQQLSGVPWITYVLPVLPVAVSATAPNNTASLKFRVSAPYDTGWFSAQFRIHIEPCSIDTVVTIRTYIVSGRLTAQQSLTIPAILCDGDRCDSVVIHNTGNASLTITAATLNTGDSIQFNRLLPKPPFTIRSGDSATMHVCFQPKSGATGSMTAQIRFRSDDSVSPVNPAIVTLHAVKDSAALALSTMVVDLGDVCVGSIACTDFTMWATGTVTDSVTVTRTGGSTTFVVYPPSTPIIVPTTAVGQCSVCFTPVTIGPASATLIVRSSPCGRVTTITAVGRGVIRGVAAVDAAVDFGTVAAGTTKSRFARFVATGSDPVHIATVALSPFVNDITIDSTRPPLPCTLRPGDSITVFVHFTPSASESRLTYLQFTADVPCVSLPTVAVSGRGVTGSMVVDKSFLDYGEFLCVIETRPDTVLVTNSGSTQLSIQLSLTGPDAADFRIAGGAAFTLAPGESKIVIVDCTPSAVGTRTADLIIASDETGSGSAPVDVAVFANRDSIAHRLSINSDTLDLGAVLPGATEDGAIDLTNLSTRGTAFGVQSADPTMFTVAPAQIVFASAGGTMPIAVHFAGRAALGRYVTAMVVTDTCGAADTVYLAATVDTVAIEIATLADTAVCPDARFQRTVMVRNRSSAIQRLILSGGAAQFTAAPDSLLLAPGDSGVVTITFLGAPTVGTYPVRYDLTDDRGVSHTFSTSVRVDTFAIVISSIADTTICPGDSAVRRVTFRNASTITQTVRLVGGAPQFSAAKNSLVIPAGVPMPDSIWFHGSSTPGTYSATFACADLCGALHPFVVTVRVVAPHIVAPVALDTTICPFTPVDFTVWISNADGIARSIALSGSAWTLSRQSILLGASAADSLHVGFAGADTGVYTSTVRVTDECGGTRDVLLTVHVRDLPPVMLSLWTDPSVTEIGRERRVCVIASPIALAGGLSFTMANEPTALATDSVVSSCFVNIRRSANVLDVSIASCQLPVSDTLMTVYYATLVGSTLAPQVSLGNIATGAACMTPLGSADATIALIPPGCELGTVKFHAFTSGIRSVYPNPAASRMVIAYATVEEATVKIIVRDALGRIQCMPVNAPHKPGAYETTVDLSTLPLGMYFVTLEDGMLVETQTVSVAR